MIRALGILNTILVHIWYPCKLKKSKPNYWNWYVNMLYCAEAKKILLFFVHLIWNWWNLPQMAAKKSVNLNLLWHVWISSVTNLFTEKLDNKLPSCTYSQYFEVGIRKKKIFLNFRNSSINKKTIQVKLISGSKVLKR